VQIWTFPEGSYDSYNTSAPITALSWSPDNEHLVLGSNNGPIHITDILSRSITPLAGSTDYFAVAWSPDGRYITAGGVGQPVKIWDSTTRQVVYTDQNHQGTITALGWSPDGKRIASAGYDSSTSTSYVEDWDALTGANSFMYTFDMHRVTNALAWSPDGSRIAAGDDEGTIDLWYEGSAPTYSNFRKSTIPVHALAWSPDGNQIACASDNGTVQIWDANTGSPLFNYQQP
jgi:WD40 repeat protein